MEGPYSGLGVFPALAIGETAFAVRFAMLARSLGRPLRIPSSSVSVKKLQIKLKIGLELPDAGTSNAGSRSHGGFALLPPVFSLIGAIDIIITIILISFYIVEL
jgi:hypothetical protein